MHITHISHSNTRGGAANYVKRIIESNESIGIKNSLLASSVAKSENIFETSKITQTIFGKLYSKLTQTIDKKMNKLEYRIDYRFKSPNQIGALSAKKINLSDTDVVHMHWVNGGIISIKQIGKIDKPIVWSMLDMWPFLGAEHYLSIENDRRYIEGYNKNNRVKGEKGLDICRLCWSQKINNFKKINLVAPSKWLADKARSSLLFKDRHIEIVPPPINTKIFAPRIGLNHSNSYGFGSDDFVIGFIGGISGRKGWHYINEIIQTSRSNFNWKFLLAGANLNDYPIFNSNVNKLGVIENINELTMFYNSIDVLLVLSEQEAYGLAAQEAQTCGTPVIAFYDTGVEDIVKNNETGFLIKNKDPRSVYSKLEDLSNASVGFIDNIKVKARQRAVQEWDYSRISLIYSDIYRAVLSN